MRTPARNALLSALLTIAGAVLIAFGATGQSGSPLLMLGLFPALLGPIGFVYYLKAAGTVRDLRSGRTSIARWTVSAEQFARFCAEDARLATSGAAANFYQAPRTMLADGVDVVFGDNGVLLGDTYFPLSLNGGRRVMHVREVVSSPPYIEFGMILSTRARTSNTTMATQRTAYTLRVPVALGAERQAAQVARRYSDRVTTGLGPQHRA